MLPVAPVHLKCAATGGRNLLHLRAGWEVNSLMTGPQPHDATYDMIRWNGFNGFLVQAFSGCKTKKGTRELEL